MRASSLSFLRATATTFAPSLTKHSIMPLPIPEDAPVTTTTLFPVSFADLHNLVLYKIKHESGVIIKRKTISEEK